VKTLLLISLIILITGSVALGQNNAQQIFDTERAFEKMVAEKGIRDGFMEFMSPLGIIFRPDPVNARESWRSRPASPASLTWNPIKIEVSSNGALAYSIGNSVFKPKGKDDTTEFYGHYLSIWTRQPNGEYRAALDTGINHDKPASLEPTWTAASTMTASESNPKKLFAGDSSIGFFRIAEDRNLAEAYKSRAAEDIYVFRDGKSPIVGRKAALAFFKDEKASIKFTKRRSFVEAGDLAYVYSTYAMIDKNGAEKEKGNFVQVWKLRDGRWVIAADVFIPLPAAKN
jgi:ketosteroid isomerase-like protein